MYDKRCFERCFVWKPCIAEPTVRAGSTNGLVDDWKGLARITLYNRVDVFETGAMDGLVPDRLTRQLGGHAAKRRARLWVREAINRVWQSMTIRILPNRFNVVSQKHKRSYRIEIFTVQPLIQQ